jgi:ribosome-binding protein aMBF1 (putative translation factor)
VCGQKGREMTGDQCRKARERLNWMRHELATATDVPLWFIAAFEDGKATPDFLVCYEVALSAALGEPRRGGVRPEKARK